MQTMPPSASTMAPPSSWNSPVVKSLRIEAVSPAALEPLPEVYIATGATRSMNFSICDFAVEGSPISSMLMSPRSLVRSGSTLREPPKSSSASAFLMSCMPWIAGAMLCAICW